MDDPTTMDLDQIRDWAARRQGWDTYTASNGITVWHRGGFGKADDPYQQSSNAHPIPATLDAIAGLMPEPWRSTTTIHIGTSNTVALAVNSCQWIRADGENEILARARLAMLATRAKDRAAKQEDDDGN